MSEEIFVAIAAYREPELRLTIESCIENAAHPERLRFGVCLQYELDGPPETQPNCLDGLDAEIRLVSYDWNESKGGCWARHKTQALYGGEDFTLQIDSHTRMAAGWDVDLIEMVRTFPSDKPLITGQLPLYDLVDGEPVLVDTPTDEVRVTVVQEWSSEGWIHHPSRVVPTETAVPRPTRILSGMFVFTTGAWNVEVRQDPEHLYTGEEFALTVRSFTWGYDLFNPSHVVAWTRHHPEGNKKFISHHDEGEVRRRHDRAIQRLRVLLGGDPDQILTPYSVGPHRTVDAFSAWSGLDCRMYQYDEAAAQGLAPALPGHDSLDLTPPALPVS
jgi:hypothetical protein